MKVIDKLILKDQPFLIHYIQTEIESMKTIQSNNTIRLYENYEDKLNFFFVMEYFEDNLLTYLKMHTKGQGLSENEALEFFV